MEVMMAALMSQRSNQLSRPPDPPYSASGDLTSYSQAPQPPDPPDFNQFGQRLSKFEFPKFDGTLLREWFRCCDEYFSLHKTPPEMRVRVASSYMIGKALQWHTDYIRSNFGIFPPWLDYIMAISAKFGDDDAIPIATPLSKPDFTPKSYDEIQARSTKELSVFDEEPYIRDRQLKYKPSQIFVKGCEVASMYQNNVTQQEEVPILSLEPSQLDVTTIADVVWIAKRCESSLLQHSSATKSRAPFSPYQNYDNQPYYERKFGNYIGHEIEFDRQCEEIEDDELKDKQPEEDVETWIMSENTQFLECVDDEFYVDENLIKVIAEETAIELVDESGYKVFKEINLNNLLFQEFQIVLLHLKESSDTVVPCRNLDTRVLSSHFFAGGITLLSKMVCAFLLPFLTMNIDSRTISLNSRSIFVDDYEVALRRFVEDRFVLRMKEICLESMKQNLEFAIDRGWVEFWTNTHDFTLTNYGLRLSPSEYTKNAFTLVYHLCKHSSFCLFLNTSTGLIGALLMVYDAKRLIQLDAPPVFSDLLFFMNRIRVRLKMVLLLELLWLILFTSKIFKSSNVHQNKNQTDQKLSSYWKLLLWLFHPLHINRWRSFFNVEVTSCSSYVKVLELIKDKASRKRKLCKNWWFKYKLNTWLSDAFHFWEYKKQINQGQIFLNGLCNELVYGIEKKKLMNVEGDIMKGKKLDHNLTALNLQICCCIGGLSASGFDMETWTVKKSLEWLNKLTIAISLAQMFLDHICKIQSTPQDMLSDRDPTFLTVRALRADLSSDTTCEFIFGQPHPVHFLFHLEETLFAVVMDRNFQKKLELIPMSKVHLSQGQNKAATKALAQWKEHPPDQATWEFYQDLEAKYPDFQP